MPVISPRRSTSSGSNLYIPPSSGSLSSSLGKTTTSSSGSSGYSSTYRSSSLTKTPSSTYTSSYTIGCSPNSYLPRSSYRSSYSSSLTGGSSTLSSSYRNSSGSSYLSGGNNDTSSAAASSRFGVSRYSKYDTRSSSDRDTRTTTTGHRRTTSLSGNTKYDTLSVHYSKKPPIHGGSSNSKNYNDSNNTHTIALNKSLSSGHISNNNYNCNSNQYQSKSSGSSLDHHLNNNNDTYSESNLCNKLPSSCSSSSLARLVATSGVDLYEKYSPAHYIPKCELSRSRSLSEATTTATTSATSTFNNNNNSNGNHCSNNNNNGNDSKQLYTNKINNNSRSNSKQLLLNDYDLQDENNSNFKDLKLSSSTPSKDVNKDINTTQLGTKQQSNNLEIKGTSIVQHPVGTALIKKNGNEQNFGYSSSYKDQNFLKTECDLARSQVAAKSKYFEKDDDNFNNNNINNYSKNIIVKPLIHKAPNRVIAKIQTNNNMNCLHNNSELLDEIKFIDSDDSDHHRQPKPTQHQPRLRPKSSIISSSNQNIFEKVNNYKFSNGGSASRTSSTLPLATKKRDFLNSIDASSIKASINKYNTLSELKGIPTTRSSTGNLLSNNVNNSIYNSKSDSHTTTTATISRLNAYKNNCTSSSLKYNTSLYSSSSNKSSDSSPSNSPQTLRKTNHNHHHHLNVSTSSLVKADGGVKSARSNTTTATTTTAKIISSSNLATPSFANVNDKKQSNKLCDIDKSVRNASIRSALPPSSPTPSRYWDRDRPSSTVTNRNSDNEEYTTYKSSSAALSSATSDSTEKSQSEGLCGLRNIGNTCFMNSVIQCLSHTYELTKFLKSQTNVKSGTKDQQILYEFAKLIREMWTPSVNSVTPLELKSAFSSKHRMYSGYNQQDAQEFLRFFLDSLHSALNSGTKGELLKIDESLSDNKIADQTWEWYSKIENSLIRDLFVGQLKSSLKCTVCGNTSVTFDPFWDLSVPLPSSSRCKLDACLESFIREEIMDGDEMPTCSKCKTRRKCTKTFTIQRFPKYLVIHLKRFSETRWSKLSNIVEFPTGERELNMGPYASNTSTNVHYTLYAISNHMGSTAGGHYVALCKHPISKKWHEFNDNVVGDDLSESLLVSSSAYLLFYERA